MDLCFQFSFNVLRNWHSGSQSSCNQFRFSSAMYKDTDFSTSSPALATIFFITVVLVGVLTEVGDQWGFDLCFPNGIEYIFVCLTTIYIFCLEEFLFRSFAGLDFIQILQHTDAPVVSLLWFVCIVWFLCLPRISCVCSQVYLYQWYNKY